MRETQKPVPTRIQTHLEQGHVNWSEHTDSVRPAIKELDRQTAQALIDAHTIVVTNSTK